MLFFTILLIYNFQIINPRIELQNKLIYNKICISTCKCLRYVSRRQNEVITDAYMSIRELTGKKKKKTDFMQAYVTVESNATIGVAKVISKMVTSPSKVLNSTTFP